MSVLLQDRVAISDEQVRVLENSATTSFVLSSRLRLLDMLWLASIPVCIVTLLMGCSIALGWVNDITAGSVSMYVYFAMSAVTLVVLSVLLPFVGTPRSK